MFLTVSIFWLLSGLASCLLIHAYNKCKGSNNAFPITLDLATNLVIILEGTFGLIFVVAEIILQERS